MSDSSSDSESFELSETSESVDSSDSESSQNVSTVETFEWEALPMELRAMCVRKLNFKTSMKLRRASRLDKLIVESSINKPKYDRMSLSNLDYGISVYLDVDSEEIAMHKKIKGDKNDKKAASLILSLLKYSHIKNLHLLGFDKDASELFDKMAAVGAVIPQLKLAGNSEGNFQLALENFGEGVELFDFLYPSTRRLERALRDPLLIPKVLNAKHIQIEQYDRIPLNTFIDLWIQYDKEFGSKLIVQLGCFVTEDDGEYNPEEDEKPMFASFVKTFADRIVYHNEEEKVVRIKTNNPEKQILMRIIQDTLTYSDSDSVQYTQNMVCQVIPATLKTEDYEKESGTVRWLE